MAEKTGIAWCDSTFNPWIGCTKVSPGCDHCYAEVSRPAMAMKLKWGPGEHRHLTGKNNWKLPARWNAAAAAEGRRHLVFCASLADVFDNEVPQEWRDALWNLIEGTPALTWLVLTKRIGNAEKMLPKKWTTERLQPNLWLGASIVNQAEADRDIWKLIGTPARTHFLSYEPGLGPVDLSRWLTHAESSIDYAQRVGYEAPHGASDRVDWVIVGGESDQGGVKARPFNLAWARTTVDQCNTALVPCFVKQLGSAPCNPAMLAPFKDRAGANLDEWPADLKVQEFPA